MLFMTFCAFMIISVHTILNFGHFSNRRMAVFMLFMAFYAFLIISVHKILNFMHFSRKHYIRTDRPTDRRTDTPSYRDARTHLKIFTNSQCHSYLPEVALANTANTTSPRIRINDFMFLMKDVLLFRRKAAFFHEAVFFAKKPLYICA